MIWLIFILIYIITVIAHILLIYFTEKECIYKVGDLVDRIEFYMLYPVMNTLVVIILLIYYVIKGIIKLLKLKTMWENFKNIKLK
jgi:hypothetical protein